MKLFSILDVKPLNTTKYLNYIAFKEALLTYQSFIEDKKNLCTTYPHEEAKIILSRSV